MKGIDIHDQVISYTRSSEKIRKWRARISLKSFDMAVTLQLSYEAFWPREQSNNSNSRTSKDSTFHNTYVTKKLKQEKVQTLA